MWTESKVRQMRRVTAVGSTVAAAVRVVAAVWTVAAVSVVAVTTVVDGLLSAVLLFVLKSVRNLIPLTVLVVQPVLRSIVALPPLSVHRHICFCILQKR